MSESKPKHTPGPWVADKYNYHWVEGSDGMSVAEIDTSYVRSKEENKANAQLIAAAPDFEVALKGVYFSTYMYNGSDVVVTMTKEKWVAIQNALRKAGSL